MKTSRGAAIPALVALCLVLFASPLIAAPDQVVPIFTAVAANGTYFVPTPNASYACVAIWAPSAATATVTVSVIQAEAVVPVTNPPYTNPTTAGKIYCGHPTSSGLLIVISGYSGGSVSASATLSPK
jgi:hypothetical protein